MKKHVISTMAVVITALLMVSSYSFANTGHNVAQLAGSSITIDSSRNVVINGVRLSDEEVLTLEQTYHIKIADGNYWYDAMCGAWGLQGGPCLGLGQAGLKLGGALRADASNGNMPVFVNGRQLHYYDVLGLQLIFGTVWPGRFWVDALGNYGYEGGLKMGNLREQALRNQGNADKTVYSKFGTLSEVGFFAPGQDPYYRY